MSLTEGPVKDILTNPEYLDVTVPPNTQFLYNVTMGFTVFAYVIDGFGYFDEKRDSYAFEIGGANYFDFKRDCLIHPESVVLFNDGDTICITTTDKSVRFLLISGKPLREPIAWYGPIVMNTKEELRIAFEEFQEGTFVKYREKNEITK